MTIIQRVATVIKKHNLLTDGDKIVVAVSGGADSLALLDILLNVGINLDLIAVYVDHGLRPAEVVVEKELLQKYCLHTQTPFIIQAVDVVNAAMQYRTSIEDTARRLRYKALQDMCEKFSGSYIATGHTADDQSEEFFIRLIRGSGPRGLSGMRFRHGNIIRPLLLERKTSLEQYLEEKSQQWCTDSSNTDRKFLRNRVRLDLLPQLKAHFNPSINNTVLQTMDILRVEDNFLDKFCDTALQKIIINKDDLKVYINGEKLLCEHKAIQRRIIEKCCWIVAARPSFLLISSILELLKFSENNCSLHLTAKVEVKKQENNLLFLRNSIQHRKKSKHSPLQINQAIPGPGTHPIPDLDKTLFLKEIGATEKRLKCGENRLQIDMSYINFPLTIRSANPGERFHPFNRPGHRKISKYFNDRKIPAAERCHYPVLLCGDKIVAILGLEIDNSVRITPDTTNILEIDWF